ncbi:hypothetical protein LTR53_007455 [Teratosphaeriaceae sp. CCFEE 6253]|nr:hypothetical protein LTR53_007455 [Teratosphaeriaceae sp. CCFEE 6253]
MATHDIHANCVATTSHGSYQNAQGDVETKDSKTSHACPRSNLFREAQFSPDGTTIVTHSEDQQLRTFVLPPDLLDEKASPCVLDEYASYAPPSNIQSYAIYPHFNLQDPSTTLVLHSSTDQPLALRNVLDYTTVPAKYNLISPTTERYLTINSLVFTNDGTHFLAGGHISLSIFDCGRNYSGPISTHKLVPGKKARKFYGAQSLGCKGIVTALDINTDGLLAAGTTEREIGLYADQGGGECVVAFSVAAPPSEKHVVTGTGIMHLRWSPDGRYLLAAERQSDGIQVYDVRNMVHRVAWLQGRKAETNQNLGVDVVPTAEGWEVWGGGTDGCVRMWRDPGQREGSVPPDVAIGVHSDPVSSAVWHPAGAVMATCSGRRVPIGTHGEEDGETQARPVDLTATAPTQTVDGAPDASPPDNRLAIWTVG